MTINEWARYLIDQYEYPKDVAKKCGRSMYEFIKENNSIDKMSDGNLTLYPLLKRWVILIKLASYYKSKFDNKSANEWSYKPL